MWRHRQAAFQDGLEGMGFMAVKGDIITKNDKGIVIKTQFIEKVINAFHITMAQLDEDDRAAWRAH